MAYKGIWMAVVESCFLCNLQTASFVTLVLSSAILKPCAPSPPDVFSNFHVLPQPYKEVVHLLPEEQPVVSGEELLQHLGEWVGEQLVLFPTEKKIKKQDYYNLAGCQCD